MQKENMQAPLSPVVTWVILGTVVLVVLLIGWKFVGAGSGNFQKGGSEALMQKVQSGGKLYEPPAAAFPPGAGPNAGSPGTMNGVPTGPPTGR